VASNSSGEAGWVFLFRFALLALAATMTPGSVDGREEPEDGRAACSWRSPCWHTIDGVWRARTTVSRAQVFHDWRGDPWRRKH